jgi:hypothetical protein
LLHRCVVHLDLVVEMLDAASNDAHRVTDALLSDRPLRGGPERGAPFDQHGRGQTAQLAAKFVR